MNLPLTRRQRQILDFFRAYVAENDISPTLEEVARHFGVNKVTIFGHVAELERKGVLSRAAKGVSRGLQLVDPSGAAPSPPGAVRVLGNIAAGRPIEALSRFRPTAPHWPLMTADSAWNIRQIVDFCCGTSWI